MKKSKVMVGLPSGPSIPISFMLSYPNAVKLKSDHGKPYLYNFRGTNAATARNACVYRMLKGNFTHLFFMDSDMVFPKKTLQRLLDRDVDIVGGFYVRKRKGFLPTAFLKGHRIGGKYMTEWVTDYREVEGIGTGCLLIKREVFEKVGVPWFEYKWSGPLAPDGHMVTEDLTFCDKAIDKGYKIWCDGTIRCGHAGSFIIWPDEVTPGKNNIEPV